MSKNIKKIRKEFMKFRKDLDEALFRDKCIKVNFYYELDNSFNNEDVKMLNSAIDNMIIDCENLRKEL